MTEKHWADLGLRALGLVVAGVLAYRSDGLMAAIVVYLSLRDLVRIGG